MAATTFLIIGLVGLILLGISAFLGTDDADVEAELDIDPDLDGDGASHSSGGGILEWFSVKAVSVAAVGFGFIGWATTANGTSVAIVWIASLLTGVALWALAVKLLFPWVKSQQGHDLQAVEAYQGLTAEVVVRIPANGIGTVQFTDPSGAVVRRDARSTHRDHEVQAGKQVLVVLSTSEHVVVDEFSFLEEIN